MEPTGVSLKPISDIKDSCLEKVQLLAEGQSIQRLALLRPLEVGSGVEVYSRQTNLPVQGSVVRNMVIYKEFIIIQE